MSGIVSVRELHLSGTCSVFSCCHVQTSNQQGFTNDKTRRIKRAALLPIKLPCRQRNGLLDCESENNSALLGAALELARSLVCVEQYMQL